MLRAPNRRVQALIGPMLSSTLAFCAARHGAAPVGSARAFIWLIETGAWIASATPPASPMTVLEALYLVALASVFALIPSGPAYAGTQDTAAAVGIKAIGDGIDRSSPTS